MYSNSNDLSIQIQNQQENASIENVFLIYSDLLDFDVAHFLIVNSNSQKRQLGPNVQMRKNAEG